MSARTLSSLANKVTAGLDSKETGTGGRGTVTDCTGGTATGAGAGAGAGGAISTTAAGATGREVAAVAVGGATGEER